MSKTTSFTKPEGVTSMNARATRTCFEYHKLYKLFTLFNFVEICIFEKYIIYSNTYIKIIQQLKPNLFHNDLPSLGPLANFSYYHTLIFLLFYNILLRFF
jgi:hypothetical protein